MLVFTWLAAALVCSCYFRRLGNHLRTYEVNKLTSKSGLSGDYCVFSGV